MNDQAALAEYRHSLPSKVVGLVMLVLGLGPLGFALATMSSPETARTAVLAGVGGLLVVGGLAIFIDAARRVKLDERIRLFADRLEHATSAGVERYPYSDLTRFEAKLVVVQNTGARYHAYRLTFGGKQIELTGGGLYDGVDEETGRLIARSTGKPMEPWL